MRAFAFLSCVAAICAMTTPSFAYPTGAEALEVRLAVKLGPDIKAWIVKEGARISSTRLISDAAARNAAMQQGATGANLDALAFLVLMQAERNADATVRGIADNDMSARASHQDERQAQMRDSQIATAQRSAKSGNDQLVETATAKPAMSLLPASRNSAASTPTAPEASAAPPGLDLQDAMDRESQLDDMVADAMKALTPTAEAAVTAMP